MGERDPWLEAGEAGRAELGTHLSTLDPTPRAANMEAQRQLPREWAEHSGMLTLSGVSQQRPGEKVAGSRGKSGGSVSKCQVE